MAAFDLFLSYASADLAAAQELEAWLKAPPRDRQVWRDRRALLPGEPDYYPPLLAGIHASAAFVLLLSPRWLDSKVTAQELSDAQAVGKKILCVVHPAIPRDPTTPEGQRRKDELEQALQASGLVSLKQRNRIWSLEKESSEKSYEDVEKALATDFAWAQRHAVIQQRLDRWKALRDDAVLLRGNDLAELKADALADAPGREPVLTDEQRAFLLESSRHEAAESARAAASNVGEAEPDLGLLLAAEGASVGTTPEGRAILLSLLHRHAMLTSVLHGHGSGRRVSGVAFSLDGQWLASVDRPGGLGDDRRAYLLVHDAATGRECKRIGSDVPLSAVAWGERWLAAASPGSVGWLRWEEWEEKFRANTPTALEGGVLPDHLAFSPLGAGLPQGEVLAWGTQWGDIGFIRVGDHVRYQGRLSDDRSSNALTGLGWLMGSRLITAEGGRLLARPFPDLEPAQEIAAPGEVFSLVSDGTRWVAACRRNGTAGLLVGEETEVAAFVPAPAPDLGLIAALAGPPNDPWFLTGSGARRSGAPTVSLWKEEGRRETLLQGEDQQITGVAADPAGRFLAAGEMRGRVWLWDRGRRSHLLREALPGVRARCLAASRAGHTALATHDGRVLTFGPGFDGDPAVDALVPFVPDRLWFADRGLILLAVAEDGPLAAVGADGGVQGLSWPRELSTPRDIAVAADAPIVAALCSDHEITILRLSQLTLTPVRTIDAGAPVLGLALDPSGQRVYAVVERLGLAVVSWRVDAPGEAPADLARTAHALPPVPIAFPGGDLVTIGDGDDLLFVPQQAPERATRHAGHDEPVRRIATGANWVASVACWFQDTEVDQMRLWTATGRPVGTVTLPGHAAELALSPDGSSVLVLGDSGRLWRVTLRTEDWVDTARRIAGRPLSPEERQRHRIECVTGSGPSSP